MPYYFAYGGNTNPIHMNRKYPNALVIGVVCIPNFKLVFQSTDWYTGDVEQAYCNIIPDNSNSVCGVLYKISEEEERLLDIQECVPFLYRKIYIPEIHAYTYIMNTDYCIESVPTSRYYKVVSYGYKYHKLPFSQIKIPSFPLNDLS